MLKRDLVAGAVVCLTASMAVPAFASPSMIRLGYTNCSACHFAPQGGGLLTDYGKSIDEAQSLRAGEYQNPSGPARHLYQDVRLLMAAHSGYGARDAPIVRKPPYLQAMYRNSTRVTDRNRLSFMGGLELRPEQAPQFSQGPTSIVVSKAAWEYRAREGLEFAVGRDSLPNGSGITDREALLFSEMPGQSTFYPTQAKLFAWSKRFHITPYVFGPGNERSLDSHEHGAGAYGGIQLRRTVLGLSARTNRNTLVTANTFGGYARLGLGSWGILAEHNFTDGHVKASPLESFQRSSSYAQLFVAPREWLVTSLVAERLMAEYPTSTRIFRVSPDVQVRLTSNFTLRFWTRENIVGPSNRVSRTYSVQLAVKTVQ